ncbi:hypothetical protein MA16_Dca000252 [Dendrobium catenatum]|uniref:Uncharacterized protein n=1 Tax=Dendrobium catenatum TaxID=906689 RepID=A0A2I0WTC1_9ASPA|nr:hypothetical protein MA16_Dca000252 [Dendrobium catenatum]
MQFKNRRFRNGRFVGGEKPRRNVKEVKDKRTEVHADAVQNAVQHKVAEVVIEVV